MSEHSPDLAALPAAHRSLPVATRNRARTATMALFFIAGMMYASWGVHVPTVRDLEELAREWAPEVAEDENFRDWFVGHMRRSLSPGAAR